MFSKEELNILETKKNILEKKDIDLIITDLDDTIFSTKEAIEKDIRKWRRWEEGNKYIVEVIWIKKFIDKFYLNKIYPKSIVSKLRKNHDLIITAWYKDIQLEKLKACKLTHINYRIVSNPEEKIIETIRYIVNKLNFIPSKIIIYEDRPKFFIEYKDFLEKFLWIKIKIIYVEMINNEIEPKLTQIYT